jgi:hypothetical protein
MSFYTMAFLGTAPFGSLLSGTLAHRIGPTWTVTIGGLSCILGAIFFARMLPLLRDDVRPIYIEKGILPEAISGTQTATRLTNPPEKR